MLKSKPVDNIFRCEKCVNAYKNVTATCHPNLFDTSHPRNTMLPTVHDLTVQLSSKFESLNHSSDDALFFQDRMVSYLLNVLSIGDVKEPVHINNGMSLVPCLGCSGNHKTPNAVCCTQFCLVCHMVCISKPLCVPCTREKHNALRHLKRKDENFKKQTATNSRMNSWYMTHEHLVSHWKNIYNEHRAMKTRLDRAKEKLAKDETEFGLGEKTGEWLNEVLKLSIVDRKKFQRMLLNMAMELMSKTCTKKLNSTEAEDFTNHILEQLDGFVK
jgi:hypothetical protein